MAESQQRARSATLPLQAYNRAKHMLGRAIRDALHQLMQRGGEGAAADCRQLLAKLAEDRFNLVVLGQYKRGKSSLLNAILGRELLPTGLLPVTSAITTIRFGAVERLVLVRDGRLDQEAPIGALAQYVTQEGNPGNVKGIDEAFLELPLPLLRQGVHLVDTPGVGSSHDKNTQTTRSFLPQADAVLFVTGVDMPLSEAETAFLAEVRHYARRTFFVANKVDLLTAQEQAQVVSYVRAGLAAHTAGGDVNLYPVSCRNALLARSTGNEALLAESGLPALMAEIATFIGLEKRHAFLLAVLDRLASSLAAAGVPLEGNESPHIRGLKQLRESLQTDTALPDVSPPAARAAAGRPEAADKALARVQAECQSEFAEILRGPGCPLCRRLSSLLFSFLADWQYALNRDEAATAAYLSSQGFCPAHTWQLAALASAQTLAEAQPALLRAVGQRLQEASELPAQQQLAEVEAASPGAPSCLACDLLRSAEQTLVARMVSYLETAQGHAAYFRRSRGVCLHHLAALLAAAPGPQTARALLRHQAARLSETAEDMESFALKYDALKRSLLHRNEENAVTRALVYVAGDRSLAVPWRLDAG